MSYRRTSTRFAVSIAAGMLLASGAGFAISACSSSTADAPAAGTDAGLDVARDTNRPAVDATPDPTVDSSVPQTLDECLAVCNTAHPNSTTKESAIDTCWNANCKGACLDNPATGFDAGEAGIPDAGPDAMEACGTGVTSGVSADCDNCTDVNCCPAWTGCFTNTDCAALDTCLGNCYTAHP